MGIEVERKFRVKNSNWRQEVFQKNEIAQGYLSSHPERTVRIRISNNQGFITIKSKTEGATRNEFEYTIPIEEATQLLSLCKKPIISKTRHLVQLNHHIWEIDVFKDENQGLIVAEIELTSENEPFKTPEWIGEEVTNDIRYYNSALISNPFSNWKESH